MFLFFWILSLDLFSLHIDTENMNLRKIQV